MGLITRERAALQSTHPTQNVKLIIHHYLEGNLLETTQANEAKISSK